MRSLIIILATFFLFAAPANAQVVGTVRLDSGGYQYVLGANNIWYWGTHPYTCTGYVTGSSYRTCNGYYSTAGYYTFAPYVAAAPVISYQNLSYHPNWKTEHAKVLDNVNDHAAYQKSLDSIIRQSNVAGLGYGGYGNNLLFGAFGYNTSTVSGYAPQSLAQLVDPFKVSLDQLYQLDFQLAQDGQQISAERSKRFNEAVKEASSASERISALNARAAAGVNFLRNLEQPVKTRSTLIGTAGPSPASIQQSTKIQPIGDPAVPSGFAIDPNDDLATAWNKSANVRCAECHFGNGGEVTKGGFSLSTFAKMDPDPLTNFRKQSAVIDLFDRPIDDKLHMPPKIALPAAEKALWKAIVQQEYMNAIKEPATAPAPAKK